MSAPTSRKRWSPLDRGMLHLVRLVLDDRWEPGAAARRLRTLVDDDAVLRKMATRIAVASADRPSQVTRRAATTLEVAIDGGLVEGEPVRSPVSPGR